jgi:hypothetical protein
MGICSLPRAVNAHLADAVNARLLAGRMIVKNAVAELHLLHVVARLEEGARS